MNNSLIIKIKSRFIFLSTVPLFFPLILESLFKIAGRSDKEISEIILYWSFQVGILVGCYVLIEISNRWSVFISRVINILIFANLLSFSLVLYIIATLINKGVLPKFYYCLFGTTFPLILILPLGILLLLASNLFIENIFKKQNN